MPNLKSVKAQLILYLICFALFLAIKNKNWVFLFTTLVAVISAVGVEAFVLYLKTKSLRITDSAAITGIIVGYVVSYDEPLWKFVFAGASAILSKHLIRFEKKHIFNPAAFGIFLTLIFLGSSTQWKGTYAWYILVPFGIYFARKIRKLEVLIGYAVISLLLFATQALMQKVSLWNIFGYFSYFYIFVMVIEPKTTPLNLVAKYLFGAGTAVLIFIFTEAGGRFDAELFSLLAMNAAVPFLNKLGGQTLRG